jgi:heptosyltransferase-2
LKASFADSQVDYVLNEEIAPLFEGHPAIDRLIIFSREDQSNSKRYLAKVRRIMREGHYDMIVDTRSTFKTLPFALFSLRSPLRLGLRKSYNRWIHNYRTDCNQLGADEVCRTLQLLRPLEHRFSICYERIFKIYVTEEEKYDFRRTMEASGIDFSKPIIVCAVATRIAHKEWDRAQMVATLRLILERYVDVQLVFNFSGEAEKRIAGDICCLMNTPPRVFVNIYARTLRELAAMIAVSSFFFGNEGGPRHLSQALDIPSFAIYPPSISKSVWLPNACKRFQGIEPDDISEFIGTTYSERFSLISTAEVWMRLQPMLDSFLYRRLS